MVSLWGLFLVGAGLVAWGAVGFGADARDGEAGRSVPESAREEGRGAYPLAVGDRADETADALGASAPVGEPPEGFSRIREGVDHPPPGQRSRPLDPMVGASEVDRRARLAFGARETTCASEAEAVDVVSSAIFGAWTTLRDSREPLSSAEERGWGNSLHASLIGSPDSPYRGRVDTDAPLKAYLTAVIGPFVDRLERSDLTVEVHVIEDAEVNAFAVPGGHIYVYTGMVEAVRNEAELAGVLAHELAHIDRRHSVAAAEVIRDLGATGTPAELALSALIGLAEQPYSSEIEDESDRYAVEGLLAVGYSPARYAELLVRSGPAGRPARGRG